MRNKLKSLEGKRMTFTGIFERVGSKTGYNYSPEPTFILNHLCDVSGDLLANHIWLNQTLDFKKLGRLNKGDLIQFDGRIQEYKKNPSYKENSINYASHDYGITRPTNFKILKRAIK